MLLMGHWTTLRPINLVSQLYVCIYIYIRQSMTLLTTLDEALIATHLCLLLNVCWITWEIAAVYIDLKAEP